MSKASWQIKKRNMQTTEGKNFNFPRKNLENTDLL